MKTLLITACIVAVVSLSIHLAGNKGGASPRGSAEQPPSAPKGSPATTNDGDEVFKRAFWKRPTNSDRILNVERREWSDDAGVTRWQWFLEVNPSPELQQHLFSRNAFSLIPRTATLSSPRDRPMWYPGNSQAFETHSSRGNDMVVLYDQANNRLFATGHGGGFHRSVTSPLRSKRSHETSSKSRLPTHSPPDPRKNLVNSAKD